MDSPTARLRAIATRVVEEARARGPLRAALLAGSAGRGDADEWSDVDLLLYVDELPPEGTVEEVARAAGGVEVTRKGVRSEFYDGVDCTVDGALVEITYVRVERIESGLERFLVELENLENPGPHKTALGILEGLALADDGIVEEWRARLREYPEPLRRALVELHWSDLFPLWHYHDNLATRDAELFRVEMLVDGALRLLGILAALNRVHYSRFHLKRTRDLTARLELAPPRLPDRLDSLLRLAPREAADELERLVEETRELVRRELPDLELETRFPPGTRQRPFDHG